MEMFDTDPKLFKKIVGNGKIKVTKGEKNVRKHGRKFLVARKPIAEGEVISRDNLTAKRSGGGISPSLENIEYFLGKVARKNLATDHIFKKRDVK